MSLKIETGADILAVIREQIAQHPRTLQKALGPSEIGGPCARKIAAKLLGHPERPMPPPWRATVGTAVHAYVERAAERGNAALPVARWLTERRVTVGTMAGRPITGTADLFDTWTGTIMDWKTCSQSKLKAMNLTADGPGDTYRTQIQLYGKGYADAGHAVNRVMIIFLPRDGELSQARIWSEDYDEQVAVAALERLNGIDATVGTFGLDALGLLPAVADWCDYCPFRRMPGVTDSDTARWCDGPAGGRASATGRGLTISS